MHSLLGASNTVHAHPLHCVLVTRLASCTITTQIMEPLNKLDADDGERQLLGLFDDLINVMFCAKDLEGRYTNVNQAFVRRSGQKSKRDVLGRRARDLFSKALAERYEEQDTRVFTDDTVLRDELELIRRPDGSLGWYLTTKRPVHDPTGAVVGLVSVSRDLITPDERGIAMESLDNVVAAVRNSIEAAPPVAELAALAGCSASQLDRRMRKVFGLSPGQYVLRVRIDHAADLLRTTSDSVATIAASSGFYDQAAFTKQFSRLIGETPSHFRSQS